MRLAVASSDRLLGKRTSGVEAGLVLAGKRRVVLVLSIVAAASCHDGQSKSQPHQAASASAAATLDLGFILGDSAPEPRQGMVWIPGGALVAGTPPDAVPRIAHEEMSGEQIILKGFYIDIYQYPNEEGGIPLTNIEHATARALCQEIGKRLCAELEWERACKGPSNWMYEYGDVYDSERCGTGHTARLMPSGLRVGCQSGFGVRDMHGAAWEWTQSEWQRGKRADRVAVRGGNGKLGDVVGRCANAIPRRPREKLSDLGFRCCMGNLNAAVVNITVQGTPGLEGNTSVDTEGVAQVLQGMPENERLQVGDPEAFSVTRSWRWRPVPNEELVAFGGCSGAGSGQRCGLVVGRELLGRKAFVAWASSGEWLPSLHAEYNPRDVWLTGGTKAGSFKRLLHYAYGRVLVGSIERAILRRQPKPKKKKSKRR